MKTDQAVEDLRSRLETAGDAAAIWSTFKEFARSPLEDIPRNDQGAPETENWIWEGGKHDADDLQFWHFCRQIGSFEFPFPDGQMREIHGTVQFAATEGLPPLYGDAESHEFASLDDFLEAIEAKEEFRIAISYPIADISVTLSTL
ncbi:hypothetical protein CCAX7_28610 [Capsulimonas corticalis]|uniref:Uncharacterized protein n=1 Tax=Capsulimonas corticalis TaxID=2219043 RepID=A0A402CT91_9BACT|nr:hypothetical protein [Capsulimonas corticalis]BDI30810.1 hypothetical protein CCAX7_28610 [Capsulimonas corticalis]